MTVTFDLFSMFCLDFIDLIMSLAGKEVDRKSDVEQAKRNKSHSISSPHPQTFPHPNSEPIWEISPGCV